MDFQTFERTAHEMFDSIPAEYREGVDGLIVERKAESHPSLPEVFTLGECRSEYYPSEFGGPGEVLSMVVLHYGSFLELSRREEEWDWDGELWETITHEVRHHLESLAAEDALEVQDYAEDQNFARREGERFEPLYFRSGERLGDGVYSVDGDVFVEMEMTEPELLAVPELRVRWAGGERVVPRPERLGDIHFVRVGELGRGESGSSHGGELFAVLVRRRGAWSWLRDLFGGRRLEVLQTGGEN